MSLYSIILSVSKAYIAFVPRLPDLFKIGKKRSELGSLRMRLSKAHAPFDVYLIKMQPFRVIPPLFVL